MKYPTIFLLVLAASFAVLAADQPPGDATPGDATPGDATLSGKVSEEATGEPVAGLGVQIYDVGGLGVAATKTDESGLFAFSGLLPGIYYVGTASHSGIEAPADLLGELFDDIPCPLGCKAVTGTPILLAAGGAARIEIALSGAGSVSGTVGDEASGEPLPHVQVYLFDTTGTSIANGATGPDGSYLVRRLPAGIYFARTFDGSGYLDELFDGAPCALGRCNPTRGTPIVVRPGLETKDVDFTLTWGGVVAGTVVDAATGEPVSGVDIEVDDSEGDRAASSRSGDAGKYAAGGLPAGRYFVRALDSAGFLGGLFDGLLCVPGACDPGAGTRVAVRPGTTTAGIDFALERGAAISGKVTAEATGEAVAGVTVSVEEEAQAIAQERTDLDGEFRVDGLRAGRYFVITSGSSELIDELHDGIPCPRRSCDLAAGTPVAVEEGDEVRIEFGLTTGGSISGRVTAEDSGEPVSDVLIVITDSEGRFAASDFSDQDGRYRASGLLPGSFRAATHASGDFFGHVFGGGPCPAVGPCDGVTGEPIRVEAGTETGDVDFLLKRGLSLSGRVYHESYGFGFARIFVTLFNQAGTPIASGVTDELGRYRIGGLPAGTFFARAGSEFAGLVFTDAGLLEELYQDVPCPFATCDVTAGTPIVLEAGAEATGVDFAMAQGGVISGSLTDEASGQPIRRPTAVEVFDSSGIRVDSDMVDQNGNFHIGALPTGTYFVRVPSSSGFIGELYGGRPCVVDCDVAAGVPVAVTSGSETGGIDFELTLGGSFAGTVYRGAAGGLTLERVDVFDVAGSFLGSVQPPSVGVRLRGDTSGYRVLGLPPGTYFVRAEAPGMVGELFGGVPCPLKCDPRAGTPVRVDTDATTEGVDFHLAAAGSFSGVVTDAATGEGVADLPILVYDAEGHRLGVAESGQEGRYTVDGLPAGTYFVRALGSRGYQGELFDGSPCPFRSCRVTTGTPVVVEVGEETGSVDFALHPNLAEAEVGGRRIAAVHYPELALPIAASGSYDLVIYGHTHEIDVKRDRSLLVNPGETGGWLTGRCTVAIVDLADMGVEIVDLPA